MRICHHQLRCCICINFYSKLLEFGKHLFHSRWDLTIIRSFIPHLLEYVFAVHSQHLASVDLTVYMSSETLLLTSVSKCRPICSTGSSISDFTMFEHIPIDTLLYGWEHKAPDSLMWPKNLCDRPISMETPNQ